MFLQIIGLVTYQQLAGWRRHAVVVIIVGAAVITPGGDLFSLVALAVPMYVLFETSIIIGWLRTRRRRRETTASGTSGG